MIDLKTKAGGSKWFESASFEHPQQTGSSYVEYTLTHNLGVMPDLTRMFAFAPLVDGGWYEEADFYNVGSSLLNYNMQAQNPGNNSVKIRIYRRNYGTLKFKFYSIA